MARGPAGILVGLDLSADCLSPDCGPALRWAWEQARERGCPLDVVTVWDHPKVPPSIAGVPLHGFPTAAQREKQVRAALTSAVVAAGLPVTGDGSCWTPPVHRHALRPPAVAAVAAAASLLVLPGEPHDGDTAYLTGSVRRRLASAVRCPVVLVSATPEGGGGDGGAACAVLDLSAEHRAELTRC